MIDYLKESDESWYIKGKKYFDNLQKYKAKNWYDWSIKNWGTKWNSYDCSFECTDENTVTFKTAWCFPEPIMRKLTGMFPDVEFKWTWADEDIGSNCGVFKFTDGEIEGGYYDSFTSESYRLYIDCWGDSPCLIEKDGRWIKRECEDCDGCD